MNFYKNFLEILVEKAQLTPEKVLFEDQNESVTYKKFVEKAQGFGKYLSKRVGTINHPVVIYADKSVECLIMMFGVLFSGNFYCVLDTKSPVSRLTHIINILNPVIIVSNDKKAEKTFGDSIPFVLYDREQLICNDLYSGYWTKLIDTDPAYVLFTSGSTGVPKGTVISHKSVMAYAASVIKAFQINEDCVLGNQTPFYFSMSVLDIYVSIMSGASLFIIPKKMFAFPKNLIQVLNEKKINTLYWVPSAMDIVVKFKAFSILKPLYLRLVMFAGETMPVKCVTYWQEELPNVTYANLFGPTEITDTCTYHILNKMYTLDESIPIGKSFNNCDVFVIDEENRFVPPDCPNHEGELYVRGSFVGEGYYNCSDITLKCFIQNPLHADYPEKVYKTGDRVCYSAEGDLLYLGRMDYQIKHMGYRIELGEIEKACYAMPGIDTCACIFVNDQIILYVVSDHTEEEIMRWLNGKLPKYMLPYRVIIKNKLAINANGKIDRLQLTKEYCDGGKN